MKALIWFNEVIFSALNSLNLAELVVSEPMKGIHGTTNLSIFLFLVGLLLLNVKIPRAYNLRTR